LRIKLYLSKRSLKLNIIKNLTYTKHKDAKRKSRYIQRHKSRENWRDPTSAGALSRYILWGKPLFRASVADYKKRFKL
jgi:hypothetical protein